MNRNLGDLVEEVFPDTAKMLLPDWKRIIAGGIDPLRPRRELQAFVERVTAAAQQMIPGAGAERVGRYQSLFERALRSRRVRYQIYRWVRRQPVLLLRIEGWPALQYMRMVEAQVPRVALGVTIERADGTLPGAVVERRLGDARAAEGEARWTLLKIAAPELFMRYEGLVAALVSTESARQGKKLCPGKPTFGNLERVLAQNPPPFFSARLCSDAHHIRNAFAHHKFTYDPENGLVTLSDRVWSWQGGVDDLFARFAAMNDSVNEFTATNLALFAESSIDFTYEMLEGGLVTHAMPEAGSFQARLDGEIARAKEALAAVSVAIP